MMKDRLSELKQGAVFTISDDEEEENGVLVENNINEENSKVYNFLKEVEEVRSCISRIQECSLCVKKKQSEILSAPMAENKTKEEMQQAMAGITPIANQIRSKLANMKTRIEQTEEDASRCGDIRIHKSQYSTLSRSFIAVMTEYNATQNDYRDRCKARIQRQLQITGRQVDDEELENMLENSREDNSVGIFTCSMTMDTQQSKQALNEIESRHNDIMQLEKNIKELHGLFLDMAVMVEQQGEMVNLIEHSVNGASEYVATAAVEINNAVELQSKARKKTICVVVIVVVVVVVLIIVIATTV